MTAEMHSLANDPNFIVEFAIGECNYFSLLSIFNLSKANCTLYNHDPFDMRTWMLCLIGAGEPALGPATSAS